MIARLGSVLDVDIHGANYRVQVISDGPPDQPGSVWGKTYGGEGPGKFVLIKRWEDKKTAVKKFYGWWSDAAGRIEITQS